MSFPDCLCRMVMTAALVGIPAAGVAQGAPHTREGVWFSGGPGYLVAWQTAPYSVRHRLSGGALRLGAGWGMDQRIQVGVGFTAPVAYDAASQDHEIAISPALTALLRVYPSPRTGLVLTGGLGVGCGRTPDAPGVAVEGGVAYDLSLGRQVSLSPYLSVLHIGDRYRPTTYGHFGLAITVD